MEQTCGDYCPLEIECFPEAIPMYYGSLEECIAGCIESIEEGYRNGCGTVKFMRISCSTSLTCDELLELSETGYSRCGHSPDPICGGE